MFEEGLSLVKAAGFELVFSRQAKVARVNPSSFMGSGLVEEINQEIKNNDLKLVVINRRLSGVQQRTLENRWKVKVLDRMGLILHIFQNRARSGEGKLQVELAQALYERSRLVRTWTHLERQRGGGGFLAGPGEKQLEIDKRLLNTKCLKLQKDLLKVRKTRSLQRSSRKKSQKPIVALVGYTNAGKSTLFNRLTGAGVLADAQVFATLDPTLRCITLPSKRDVFLFDTVGFISNLPHELVDAFRATLEEITQADLILHIRDGYCEQSDAQAEDVEKILSELPQEGLESVPMVEVMNKRDLATVPLHDSSNDGPVWVSALSGEGCEALLERIDRSLKEPSKAYSFSIPLAAGALLAWLYGHGCILEDKLTRKNHRIRVRLTGRAYGEFKQLRDSYLVETASQS